MESSWCFEGDSWWFSEMSFGVCVSAEAEIVILTAVSRCETRRRSLCTAYPLPLRQRTADFGSRNRSVRFGDYPERNIYYCMLIVYCKTQEDVIVHPEGALT